jgi:ornithine carbamoyltransferase
MNKDLISISDLSPEELGELLGLARHLKVEIRRGKTRNTLAGRTLALVFEKPSLRTQATFEVGMHQVGGHAIFLGGANVQLGVRESIPDAARNLERWVHGVAARTFAHKTVTDLAAYAHIPVINALTDREHPCQALAWLMTVGEKRNGLSGSKLAFVGDGNNVAHSLMLLCPKAGMDFVVCCPPEYEPDADVVEAARALAKPAGTSVEVLNDLSGVEGADFVYTDVWASMGQEDERVERARVFRPFQVNAELLTRAHPDCLVSHCLPAHRGEEITDGVLDGAHSIAFDEAENRLHVQKALLLTLIA